MDKTNPHATRIETIIAATLYLMNAYQRTHCPRLARCVAAHLDYLTRHSDTDATIRSVCAEMYRDWRVVAQTPFPCEVTH